MDAAILANCDRGIDDLKCLRSHGYLAPVETDPVRRESLVIPAAKTPVSSVQAEDEGIVHAISNDG